MRTRLPLHLPVEEFGPAWPHPHEVLAEMKLDAKTEAAFLELHRESTRALGFVPHQGENRRTRRAAVANWQPPKDTQEGAGETAAQEGAPAPTMPTRRELWLQRAKHRRGKLDPALRRLQRERLKQK